MKKIRYWIFIVIFSAIFFGCGLIPQKSDIVIKNNSNYEVKNIKLTYDHAYDNVEKVIKIKSLQKNKTWKTTVEIAEKSYMSYTSGVDIEYYINDKKYDINNSDGMGEGVLANGWGVKFTIKDESYSVTRIEQE